MLKRIFNRSTLKIPYAACRSLCAAVCIFRKKKPMEPQATPWPKGFDLGFRAFGLRADAESLFDLARLKAEGVEGIEADIKLARDYLNAALGCIGEIHNQRKDSESL